VAPNQNPPSILVDIRHWTDELATHLRERAVASSAYRREWSRVWGGLVREGRSATEASKWADAGTVVLKSELEKLDADIAVTQAELAYHRDALAVGLSTHHGDSPVHHRHAEGT